MSAMIAEVYDAFRSVGATNDQAKAAASALHSHDARARDDISEVKGEIVGMRKDIQWLKWAVCGIFLIMLADLAQGFLG